MAKVLAHHLADLRLDLKDTGALWSDAELTRCLHRAVADLSRFLPREKQLELSFDFTVSSESFTTPTVSDPNYFVVAKDISASVSGNTCTIAASTPDVPRPVLVTVTDANLSITELVIIIKGTDVDGRYLEEFFYLAGGLVQTGNKYFAVVSEVEIDKITGNGAADVLDVGTGSADGVYVQLANKPIKFQSETITGYTLETDYLMDYSGGRIAMKSGGTMVVNTAYTIAEYTKNQTSIDISKIADDLIRIDRVEYPTGLVPQEHHRMEVWGSTLTLTGSYESQAEASDDEHVVINYLTSHSPPSAQAPGSYPSFLDFTVQLAASAYALFMMAAKYEHQAVLDYASARTALDGVGTYSGGASAPSAKKYLDDGDAKIDYINVGDRVAEMYAVYAQRSNDITSAYLSQSNQYITVANANLELAQSWRQEAIERRNEAWAIWKDAPQFAPMYSLGARTQAVNE